MFDRSFNLREHIDKKHDQKRPFKCSEEGCPKATAGYSRRFDLNAHIAKKHPTVPLPEAQVGTTTPVGLFCSMHCAHRARRGIHRVGSGYTLPLSFADISFPGRLRAGCAPRVRTVGESGRVSRGAVGTRPDAVDDSPARRAAREGTRAFLNGDGAPGPWPGEVPF